MTAFGRVRGIVWTWCWEFTIANNSSSGAGWIGEDCELILAVYTASFLSSCQLFMCLSGSWLSRVPFISQDGYSVEKSGYSSGAGAGVLPIGWTLSSCILFLSRGCVLSAGWNRKLGESERRIERWWTQTKCVSLLSLFAFLFPAQKMFSDGSFLCGR